MLEQEIVHKIEEFVLIQPRSILEISEHLGQNWRTVARYVDEIESQFGSIKTKTFRGGTRGALKVVYWNLNEKISKNSFQSELEQQIFSSREKEDFSAFDIFQIADTKKKIARTIIDNKLDNKESEEFVQLFKSVKKQLFIFSGNLSWVNLKSKNVALIKMIEELVKKGIKIKVICDVSISSINNIEKLLSINFKNKSDLIEIHHRKQPLRGMLSDSGVLRIKEVLEPTNKINEPSKRLSIFYTIQDKDIGEWMIKIFYKMFNTSVDSSLRLNELNKVFISNKAYKQGEK